MTQTLLLRSPSSSSPPRKKLLRRFWILFHLGSLLLGEGRVEEDYHLVVGQRWFCRRRRLWVRNCVIVSSCDGQKDCCYSIGGKDGADHRATGVGISGCDDDPPVCGVEHGVWLVGRVCALCGRDVVVSIRVARSLTNLPPKLGPMSSEARLYYVHICLTNSSRYLLSGLG